MPELLKEREASVSRSIKHRIAAAEVPAVAPAAAAEALVFCFARANMKEKLSRNMSSPSLTVEVVMTFLQNG